MQVSGKLYIPHSHPFTTTGVDFTGTLYNIRERQQGIVTFVFLPMQLPEQYINK